MSENKDKIIDSHVHMGIYGPYEIRLEELAEEMDQFGVVHPVITDIGLNTLTAEHLNA